MGSRQSTWGLNHYSGSIGSRGDRGPGPGEPSPPGSAAVSGGQNPWCLCSDSDAESSAGLRRRRS